MEWLRQAGLWVPLQHPSDEEGQPLVVHQEAAQGGAFMRSERRCCGLAEATVVVEQNPLYEELHPAGVLGM